MLWSGVDFIRGLGGRGVGVGVVGWGVGVGVVGWGVGELGWVYTTGYGRAWLSEIRSADSSVENGI